MKPKIRPPFPYSEAKGIEDQGSKNQREEEVCKEDNPCPGQLGDVGEAGVGSFGPRLPEHSVFLEQERHDPESPNSLSSVGKGKRPSPSHPILRCAEGRHLLCSC